MFVIYLLAFFAFIPVLAYLLSQNTKNKGYIFGISFLVVLICLFTVVGRYSFLGSIKNQKINSEILMDINANNKISENITREFNKSINNEDKVYWLQNYINKAIEDNKFIAAESLISISEQYFQTTDEKFIFYTLYTKLRDAKFPDFSESKLIINLMLPVSCSSFFGTAELYIMNGPKIPIASKKFTNSSEFIFKNIDSSIPGFDLASAYLNQETLDLKVSLNCSEIASIFYSENALLFDKNQPINSYNIEANEWFKREQ
jgi:hypothetical protein